MSHDEVALVLAAEAATEALAKEAKQASNDAALFALARAKLAQQGVGASDGG